MTMLAHSLKDILSLVPEALPLVKKASVDKEFPLDNRDSCIASALQVEYFKNVDYSPVDFMMMEKIAKAVDLYGVGHEIQDLSAKMVKAASAKKIEAELNNTDSYFLKEAGFVGEIPTLSVSERSQAAQALYKQAQEQGVDPHDAVKLYSGNVGFDKEAALKALTVRYNETGNNEFVKVARMIVNAVSEGDTRLAQPEALVKVANFVTKMDEDAGLQFKGFNFYQETMHVKQAAYNANMTIKLAGQAVPYTKIERVGADNITRYIGKDVAQELAGGPDNFKAVAETLPLDLQRLLLNLTKNV